MDNPNSGDFTMQREEWMPSASLRDVIAAWFSALLFVAPIVVMSFETLQP
jgi:hypothetical protein